MRWLAFIILVLGLASCDDPRVWSAKRAVADQTRDPGSVQFRNVRVVPRPGLASAVCGEFNAKNAYGGYAGFAKFMDDGTTLRTDSSDLGLIRSTRQIEANVAFLKDHARICDGITDPD